MKEILFFSNYQSQKARDFKESNKVSLVFFGALQILKYESKG